MSSRSMSRGSDESDELCRGIPPPQQTIHRHRCHPDDPALVTWADHEIGNHQASLLDGPESTELGRNLSVFAWTPLRNSRQKYGPKKFMVIWAVPFFLAACGFFLQNFQLRIGTYHYVHKMLQYDLVRTQSMQASNYTEPIPLTIGQTPLNVSFGSLDDPMTSALGPYQKVNISVLDMLAALFPFFFVVFAIAMDKPFVMTRVMLCFCVLAVGKGFFAWITIVPDSNGWQACKARLAPGSYSVEWYAKERSVLEILLMDPRSRLCADMMWSGHTYFVTVFALGLHEAVRRGMKATIAWHRILAESLVATAAILQQTVEIYFVLKSRFHYTSDVVMAIFVTYLLYTNSTIAVVAAWWTTPEEGRECVGEEFHGNDSKWLKNGFGSKAHANISLGCCCCSSSRQWLYTEADIHTILDDVETATRGLPKDDLWKMDHDTRLLLTDGMGMLRKHSICGNEPEYEGQEDDAEEEEEEEEEKDRHECCSSCGAFRRTDFEKRGIQNRKISFKSACP